MDMTIQIETSTIPTIAPEDVRFGAGSRSMTGVLSVTGGPYTSRMRVVATGRQAVARWIAVAFMMILALLGVPAIMSVLRPQRTRDDGRVVLIVGQDLRRIG
jgi:hypothetical protein